MGRLVILSLLQNPDSAVLLPVDLDKLLPKSLDATDTNLWQIQITSESISYHAEMHPERLPNLVTFIKDNAAVESCLLEVAIVRRFN